MDSSPHHPLRIEYPQLTQFLFTILHIKIRLIFGVQKFGRGVPRVVGEEYGEFLCLIFIMNVRNKQYGSNIDIGYCCIVSVAGGLILINNGIRVNVFSS